VKADEGVGAGLPSVRRGLGCPVPNTADSSRFQLASVFPSQDTAEPISQVIGISMKCIKERVKNNTQQL